MQGNFNNEEDIQKEDFQEETTNENNEEILENVEENISQDKKTDEKQSAEDEDSKIAKLQSDLEDMTNTAKRAQADFMNYKKRVEKEKASLSAYAVEKLMTDLLIVLDNFDRAMESMESKDNDFYKGVELIKKQLFDTLTKYGLEEIMTENSDFDPNFHHAVLQEEKEGFESGKITEVLQKGFKLKDKVIRASMVKVAK